MHRYIGFDVHTQSCTAAVMGPTGRRLRQQVLETNGKVIRDFVCSVAGKRHVCLEEGTQSDWLYELLEPLVDELVVVVPEKNRRDVEEIRSYILVSYQLFLLQEDFLPFL